jgi:hypothetical protein
MRIFLESVSYVNVESRRLTIERQIGGDEPLRASMNEPDDAVRRRARAVGVFLIVAAATYVMVFVIAKTSIASKEQTFTSADARAGPALDVYLDVTAIEPVRQSMDLRLDVATGSAAHGRQYFGRLDRDVELRVSDGEAERDFQLRRGEPLTSAVFVTGLEGAVAGYPFDRYATTIELSATVLSGATARPALPIRARVWAGVPGWRVDVTNVESSGANRELKLAVQSYRPAPLVFFVCVIYGLMVLVAVCAAAIGGLTFIGIRRLEVTLAGALTGMVFALPILRNAVPGAPPLGVNADVFILLWAEVAVLCGLTLFVTAWIQRGAKP